MKRLPRFFRHTLLSYCSLSEAKRMALPSTALLFFLITAIALGGCGRQTDDRESLREVADSFALNYYNWHFQEAARFCLPESEQWLRFAASNVCQADIDSLRVKAEDAGCEIESCEIQHSDTTATVRLLVSDVLLMDTIGSAARHYDKVRFSLLAVKRDGVWKISLSAMPAPER